MWTIMSSTSCLATPRGSKAFDGCLIRLLIGHLVKEDNKEQEKSGEWEACRPSCLDFEYGNLVFI